MLKRRLQKDLRAKPNKKRSFGLLSLFFLLGLLGTGSFFYWNKHRPAALLRQGLHFEQQGKTEEALALYQDVYSHYKKSPQSADALLHSGSLLEYEKGKEKQALLLYLTLEHDYPQNPLVLTAQKKAADLTKYRLHDCGQAIPIYQRLREGDESTEDQSQYEIADCYARLNNWSQAAIEFQSLLAEKPVSAQLPLILYRLADSLLLSGEKEKARRAYKRLIKDDPDHELSKEAAFDLAGMLEAEEHLEGALNAFVALKSYPRQDILKQRIVRLKKRIKRKKKVL